MKQSSTITISELRKDTLSVLKKISETPQVFTVFSRSKPVFVIMSQTAYEGVCQREDDGVSDSHSWDFLTSKKKRGKGPTFSAVELVRSLR